MYDPINMAVMDTLQDLLYAVAEGGKVINECRIAMEQTEGETEGQGRKAEKKRRRGRLTEGKKRGNNISTVHHKSLSVDFLYVTLFLMDNIKSHDGKSFLYCIDKPKLYKVHDK